MKITIYIVALVLVASGCATRPSQSVMSAHCPPAHSLLAYLGSYQNTSVSADADSHQDNGDDSLYHILIQKYYGLFSGVLHPIASTNAVTTIEHTSGNVFSVTLHDNGNAVETRNIKLRFADGYLHSRRKWRFIPLLLVNGFNNEVFSLALDEEGYLHAFESFFGAGGFFIFFETNRTRAHARFRPISATHETDK